jgi:hypothetical protein
MRQPTDDLRTWSPEDGESGGSAAAGESGSGGAGAGGEQGGQGAGAGGSTEEGKTKPWWQQRIDQTTAKWRGAEERATELERENALLSEALRGKTEGSKAGAKDTSPDPALTEAEIEKRAQAKAKELAAQQQYQAMCNGIADLGRKAHDDFDVALVAFNKLGGLDNATILAAAETDAPHEVLYYLGKNLDKAQEIMGLPPLKRAIACERLARDLHETKGKGKNTTKAPPPPERLEGGRGTITETDPRKMDKHAWMAWRQKQLAENRGAVH